MAGACWLAACGSADQAPSLTRLHAEGTRIVDANGAPITLRGVNLGAWAYHETWISLVDYDQAGRAYVLASEQGFAEEAAEAIRGLKAEGDDEWLEAFGQAMASSMGAQAAADLVEEIRGYRPILSDDSDRPLYEALEGRFGQTVRDELIDAFMGAWVAESDIRWLAERGFNLVRVPIGYRVLTAMSHLEPPTSLVFNELAFARLEALLDWCARSGVYAIIDIQECPGGQNGYSGPGTLYQDPAMQALTVALWQELSRRFGDRDEVAAYSLLAEPMSAPSTQARDDMYDLLVQAIRDRGDDHLLVLHDGFRGLYGLPDPEAYGWQDVIYSTHLFEGSPKNVEDYQEILALYESLLSASQSVQGVPYFIGSFSTMHDVDWAYESLGQMVDWMEGHDWSWSLWTYKKLDDPIHFAISAKTSAWGLRGGTGGGFARPDVYRDDLEALRTKLAAYAEIQFEPNNRTLEHLGLPR
jgi:aryl-phospho-beta-D-glucosidase BglC (GH1 family)